VSQDARPAAEFKGDTLMVLDQTILSNDRLATTLRGYLISGDSCSWRPTVPLMVTE